MPSIKQSQNIRRGMLEPESAALDSGRQQVSQLPPFQRPDSSPFMVSSLPPSAAGLDQYQRQFYERAPGLPIQRVLPVGIEDGEVET